MIDFAWYLFVGIVFIVGFLIFLLVNSAVVNKGVRDTMMQLQREADAQKRAELQLGSFALVEEGENKLTFIQIPGNQGMSKARAIVMAQSINKAIDHSRATSPFNGMP